MTNVEYHMVIIEILAHENCNSDELWCFHTHRFYDNFDHANEIKSPNFTKFVYCLVTSTKQSLPVINNSITDIPSYMQYCVYVHPNTVS